MGLLVLPKMGQRLAVRLDRALRGSVDPGSKPLKDAGAGLRGIADAAFLALTLVAYYFVAGAPR
jgi:hypothetical protein